MSVSIYEDFERSIYWVASTMDPAIRYPITKGQLEDCRGPDEADWLVRWAHYLVIRDEDCLVHYRIVREDVQRYIKQLFDTGGMSMLEWASVAEAPLMWPKARGISADLMYQERGLYAGPVF